VYIYFVQPHYCMYVPEKTTASLLILHGERATKRIVSCLLTF